MARLNASDEKTKGSGASVRVELPATHMAYHRLSAAAAFGSHEGSVLPCLAAAALMMSTQTTEQLDQLHGLLLPQQRHEAVVVPGPKRTV